MVGFLTFLADKFYKKSFASSVVFSAISILVLCVFASIRDYSVGIDLLGYGIPMFKADTSIAAVLDVPTRYGTIEYLYHFTNFVINSLFGSPRVFLFVHQLVMSLLVFSIAFREKEKHSTSICLTMITYLFFYYFMSFNIIRQTLSCTILLWGYKYLEEENYKKYLLTALVATLFHQSSLIALVCPIIYKICSKVKSGAIIIPAITASAIFAIYQLLSLAVMFIPTLSKYFGYLKGDSDISWKMILMKLILLAFVIIFYKKSNASKSSENKPLLCMVLLDAVFYLSTIRIKFGYRLSYPFLPYFILLIPRIDAGLESKKDKAFFRIGITALLVGYFVVRFIIIGFDGIYPYMFGV